MNANQNHRRKSILDFSLQRLILDNKIRSQFGLVINTTDIFPQTTNPINCTLPKKATD